MAIDRPPLSHKDAEQHRRKLALASHNHADRIKTLEGLPTGIQGTYDHLNDIVLAGVGAGAPLPAATNFTPGDFFELDAATGAFTTPLPELNGLIGTKKDTIVATSQGDWLFLSATGAYLSSEVDDSAEGVITFNKPAKGLNPALDSDDYIRKGESEGGDATTLATANSYTDGEVSTHAALTASVNDVHGAATYTNQEITAHKNEMADPDDAHGSATYTDREVSAHASLTASANDAHGAATYTDQEITAHKNERVDPDDVHGTKTYSDAGDVAVSQWVADKFVFSAYASARISSPEPVPNLGGGWQPMDFFDEYLAAPHDMSLGLDGVVSFVEPGVYMGNVTGSLEHNSSNQGRTFSVRLYNITDGIAGSGVVIGTGRNAEATTVPLTFPFVIAEADVGKQFRVEYGGGDTYTSVIWNALILNVWQVSHWQGADLPVST